MSVASFIERCVKSGMPIEFAIEAAKAFEVELEIALDVRKAKDRARQAKKRARDVTECHVTERDNADIADRVSPSLSPPDPPNHTPIRKEFSTRARDGWPEFWLAYPRKVGKGKAETAYRKALRLIEGPDPPAVLLAALERVKLTWTDAQFIPHAATWLNERRWEDEPEPRHERRNHSQRPERITGLAGIIARNRNAVSPGGIGGSDLAGCGSEWGDDTEPASRAR